MHEELDWLRKYVAERDEEAFRRLIDRYIDLVYSAARRQVGEAELARDVTQAVFLILAQKAAKLDRSRPLSAWLLQVTRYASANAIRARATRQRHEQKAAEMTRANSSSSVSETEWQAMSPLLDDGMSSLRAADRDVLVLRFFEKKTARQVAEALSISEDAAEKRFSRAVERLREFFRRRGVNVSAMGLTSGLIERSIEAAPVGLSGTIGATAASGVGVGAVSIAKGAVVTMAYAKAKVVAVVAIASVFAIGGGITAYKATQTPARRQIDVVQPVAQKTARPAKVPPESMVFSDGTRVDLIGITNTPGREEGWWRADGSSNVTITPAPPVIGKISAPTSTVYQFLLHKFAGGAKDAQIGVDFDIPTGGSSSRDVAPGKEGDINVMAAIPSNVQRLNLRVTCRRGPFDLDWSYPLNRPRDPAATQPAGLSVGKVYEQSGKTQIEIRDRRQLPPDRFVELRVATASGKEINMSGATGRMFGPTVYEFDVALKDAVALVSRSRPMETLHFRNVSLRPTAAPPPPPAR